MLHGINYANPDDTAASEHGADAETTEVPPPAADEPDLAWSHDTDTDESQPNRHRRLMWAGLSVLVVAAMAALILLLSTLFGRTTSTTSRPQPVSSPPVNTTMAAAPPPAPTSAEPPTTTARTGPVFTPEKDQELLSKVVSLSPADQNRVTMYPSSVVNGAHQYCLALHNGWPESQAKLMSSLATGFGDPVDTDRLTSSARAIYPGCTP